MNDQVISMDDVSLTVEPPVARFNLRIAPGDLDVASEAFGVKLSTRIGDGAQKDTRAAYCIGPDEWLLHAAPDDQNTITTAFAQQRAKTPHSLSVISDREIIIAITGQAAMELLSVGCPLDLSRMPVGNAKRTVFDSAQVVLIRDGDDAFRIEVWRSFFPHVHGLLEIAMREFAVGL